MPDRAPQFTFPGIAQIVSLSATFSHGITPSVFTLVIAPQDDFEAAAGDLMLSDGVATIAFRDCKVDEWAQQEKERYTQQAFDHLEAIAVVSGRKQALLEVADFLLHRQH